VLGALFVARSGAADPPKKQIIVIDGDGFGRPAEILGHFRRVLEAARPSLTACHEIALAEDPATAVEIDADVRLAPNGEVTAVSLTPRGAVPEVALPCFRRRLASLIFEPPGGGGVTVTVALLLGDPRPEPRPPLPFRVDREPATMTLRPIPLRLTATPPAPAFRAVRAAIGALKTCAASSRPARPVVVEAHLLVGDKGEVARLQAAGPPEGEGLARCVALMAWPAPHGVLARVDLRLSVGPDGEVSLAP
jgi:hypothetical protein